LKYEKWTNVGVDSTAVGDGSYGLQLKIALFQIKVLKINAVPSRQDSKWRHPIPGAKDVLHSPDATPGASYSPEQAA
jgi:hypothetical protein